MSGRCRLTWWSLAHGRVRCDRPAGHAGRHEHTPPHLAARIANPIPSWVAPDPDGGLPAKLYPEWVSE